ncbi:MAG: glycogen/starch/alpha-glucan phosphorylase [Eubacteriales bacterium]|nr:glycogen/starch/alpha-glucan phosphorylase [Eubacteriales bacterium]
MDKNRFQSIVEGVSAAVYAKTLRDLTKHEFWTVIAYALVALQSEDWVETTEEQSGQRKVHYFSAEFLVGRSLLNNIVNAGLHEFMSDFVHSYGYELADLEEEETDPGLGNGGLGRLAACFLDSCANLRLPVTGYGIMYRYGLFRQEFEDGFQKEFPDAWCERPYPFTVRSEEDKVLIRFNDFNVWAVPYNLPVTAYHDSYINSLKLWRAEPFHEFDFNLFNSQRFDDAVIERNRVNDIFRVLYPNDTSYDGKVLRVRQQYFFVAASLKLILRDFKAEHGTDFTKFPDYNVIQLNDTHPVLAIPELIRLLIDEEGLSFDQAWAIAQKTFAYTNHTILAEAMEKWDISIFQFLFPRVLEIIKLIDRRFRAEGLDFGLQHDEIEYLSPIHDGQVHMAWLACYTCFSINGVAEIHTEILKGDTLKQFYRIFPERFSAKTNGVTPRRWLRLCNPELSELITELLGNDKWVKDLKQLEELEKYASDEKVLRRFLEIKTAKKQELSNYLQARNQISLNPDSLFDVQCKRIHEYKRQHLNAFAILHQYNELKEGKLDMQSFTPVTYLFGGKSAPGYFRARAMIKFINEISRMVNNDKSIKDLIKVHFIPNYNVSVGEKLFPAADLSIQISTVGKEASGTGNMKFMMNGALTLGTWDGANVEIVEAAGEENNYMFGVKPEDFKATLDYYNSQWQYENVPGLKKVVDSLVNGQFDDAGTGMFNDLYNALINGSSWEKADIYYALGDFTDFYNRRLDAQRAYPNELERAKMAWANICSSGVFSSDRTIMDYAKEIWHIA